jgi:hypothetical protein
MWWILACAPPSEEPSIPEAPPEPTTTPESGGQTGEDPGGSSYASCEPTTTDGDPDDVVQGWNGPFTANDLVGLAEGTFEGTLTWADGTETSLVADLRWDGAITLLDAEYPSYCRPKIHVDGHRTFTTGDGGFAESGPSVLTGAGPRVARLFERWRSVDGSFVFPDGVDVVRLSSEFDRDGFHGTIWAGSDAFASFEAVMVER